MRYKKNSPDRGYQPLEKNPNPGYIPPAVKPTADRKCPYRKIYTCEGQGIAVICNSNTVTIKEEFQDCIGKECAKWSPIGCSA